MANEIWALDLEQRREIGALIRRLDRPQRIAWLLWCCAQVSVGEKTCMLADVLGTERETWEHWKALCVLWDLNVQKSRDELLRRVRLHGAPLAFGVR